MITQQRPIRQHAADVHYTSMKQGILGRSSSASEAPTKYQQHEPSTYHGGRVGVLGHPTRRTCSVPQADTKTPKVDVAFLMACKIGDEAKLRTIIATNPSKDVVNQQDRTGRTGVSYACTEGQMSILQMTADIPGLDANLPDNEGNSPLMLASQAGHAEIVAFLLDKFRGNLSLDQRNIFGLTALMKASLQGRSRCVKLLLNTGASPNLRDPGRRFTPLEWARFCGRQPCAEMIEKFVKNATKRFSPLESKILSTTTSSKNRRTSEADLQECLKKPPMPPTSSTEDNWLKQKLRKTLRSEAGKPRKTEFSLLTNITAASMMCASSAIMPNLPEQQASGGMSAEKRDSKGNIVPIVPKVEVTHAVTPSLSSDDSLEQEEGNVATGKPPKPVTTKRKKN